MPSIIIEGNTISYSTKEEVVTSDQSDANHFYKTTYAIADTISTLLQIQCPDIGFVNTIYTKDDMGMVSVMGAKMFTPADIPSLENNLIIMSRKFCDWITFSGILAHEMRHIWQHTYHPEMINKPAKGFGESLMNPAEIDADGYAIRYISERYNMYIEKAASIMCPEEKKHYPKAFMYRIEKAKEFTTNFEAPHITATPKRTSFWKKIKQLFR